MKITSEWACGYPKTYYINTEEWQKLWAGPSRLEQKKTFQLDGWDHSSQFFFIPSANTCEPSAFTLPIYETILDEISSPTANISEPDAYLSQSQANSNTVYAKFAYIMRRRNIPFRYDGIEDRRIASRNTHNDLLLRLLQVCSGVYGR